MPESTNRTGDQRGVSEIIGFVLVFSLVIGTVGMVYVGGFSALDSARNAEQLNNAERAFNVLAQNLEQLARGNAPSRTTEIKLAGASISFGPERTFEVNDTSTAATNASAGGPRAIVYSPADSNTEIVYEAGAVIRAQPGGSVMLREPDFVLGERATIRVISPYREGSASVGGDTSVLLRSSVQSSSLRYQESNATVIQNDVNITLDTAPERTDAWVRYFESHDTVDTCVVDASHGGEETARVTCTDLRFESLSVARAQLETELA
jgi:hypothetical protein